MTATEAVGPLAGLRVIELAAVGPGPFAAMILADLGADVVRVDRPGGQQLGRPDASDPMLRGRHRVDALWHAGRSGQGQVVDAAMVDGVSLLSQKVWSWLAQGLWQDEREANFIDGYAPWYRAYACADGKFMAVGAIEPQFYAEFLRGLGLDSEDLPPQRDPGSYPVLAKRFEEVFASRTRDEWAAVFDDLDACTTPVLSWTEVPRHPHLAERQVIVTADGATQVAPAPRFSRTPARLPDPMSEPVAVSDVLGGCGRERGRRHRLRRPAEAPRHLMPPRRRMAPADAFGDDPCARFV